jgi:2-dehydropantoate 2-reductase
VSAPHAGPILIYGAGAVGQFLGGSLALAGQEVVLLARPALRAALDARPLTIISEAPVPQDPIARTIAVPAVERIAELSRPPALVILAVKGYDTAGALPDLQRLVADGATVLTVQNGVGHEETLRAALGAAAVRSGAFTISVSITEPGRVVRHTAKGGLGFAPLADEDLTPLLGRFQPIGLPIVTARSYRVLKWSKLLLNMLGNAQSALLDLPPAALYADPALFAIERRAFAEARAVMRAAGIGLVDLPAYQTRALAAAMALPGPLARRLLARRVGAGRGAKRPSLALDLRARGGRSEVPWYNGAVVALGEAQGVPTPVNAVLTHLLQSATTDPAAWARFRGQPARLLAELD